MLADLIDEGRQKLASADADALLEISTQAATLLQAAQVLQAAGQPVVVEPQVIIAAAAFQRQVAAARANLLLRERLFGLALAGRTGQER